MKAKLLLAAFVASLIVLPWMAFTGDVRDSHAWCVEGAELVGDPRTGNYLCREPIPLPSHEDWWNNWRW